MIINTVGMNAYYYILSAKFADQICLLSKVLWIGQIFKDDFLGLF